MVFDTKVARRNPIVEIRSTKSEIRNNTKIPMFKIRNKPVQSRAPSDFRDGTLEMRAMVSPRD